MWSARHYFAVMVAVVLVASLVVLSTNRSDVSTLKDSIKEMVNYNNRPPLPATKGAIHFSSNNADVQTLLEINSKIRAQRDATSRQRNEIRKKLGQAECKIAANSTKNKGISESGGWCERQSTEKGGQHITDHKLALFLANFLKGKRVASFGDGPGRYKALVDDTKLVQVYDAYDGAPFCETTSEGRVKFLDLTLEQYGIPVYDYVISLEVAEHIPREFEDIYLSNIVRHAKEGVIISWAKLGQGGFHHVNNKAFEDVKAIFQGLGFEHNVSISNQLKQTATLGWLKQNTNLFSRMDPNSFDELST